MSLQIFYICTGAWKENAYIIIKNKESILIDPGDNFSELDTYFKTFNTNYKAIINTHGHFDHVGAVEEFRRKYSIPFYIHSKDKRLVHQANLFRKLTGVSGTNPTPTIDFFLDNLISIELSDTNIKIHHVPGHSEGSVVFEVENNLIIGDLFFNDSIGRNDLPGGNLKKLMESISYVLDNFKNFMIYPGHGTPFLLNEAKIDRLKNICNEYNN
ncbi:MAG: MBL fold metallo-hydrolase [Chitinophagaceae bacterium]|nr:MBL fold metallo-hydrolase [Chitinophagaceae bacterium]